MSLQGLLRIGRIPLLCVGASLLAACQAGKPVASSRRVAPLPSGEYSTVSWLNQDRIVVIRDWEVWDYNFESSAMSLIWPAQDSRCERYVRYSFATALPDGRLGLLERCGGRFPEMPPPRSDECYILALDLQTHEVSQLVEKSMPPCSLAGPYEFTWNPIMTRGLQSVGGLFSTLYWITAEGYEPLELRLTRGLRSWSLEENLEIILEDADSTRVGVADAPEWSPDGSKVAFIASFDAIGRSGPDRWEGEYLMYLMDPESLELEVVLTGLHDHPRDIAWSPDGELIAITESAGLVPTDGVWLYSIDDGTFTLIDRGAFKGVAWSPDGSSLAALRCVGPICEEDELWIWDLAAFP